MTLQITTVKHVSPEALRLTIRLYLPDGPLRLPSPESTNSTLMNEMRCAKGVVRKFGAESGSSVLPDFVTKKLTFYIDVCNISVDFAGQSGKYPAPYQLKLVRSKFGGSSPG